MAGLVTRMAAKRIRTMPGRWQVRLTTRVALTILGLVMLGGCQPQVFLMPTPEALREPEFNLFAINPAPLTSNEIVSLYATTRIPSPDATQPFSSGVDDKLRVGSVAIMVGKDGTPLSTLIAQSTTEERTDKFLMSLLDAPVFASLPSTGRPSRNAEAPEGIDALNAFLALKPTQELTIYVHGANNNFYEAVARGTMFQFFSGDNAPALSFSWPSPGSKLRYGTDKRVAEQSAKALANLIEYLATHSIATEINLLAYSAGGRAAGGALAELARRELTNAELRLGDVYFAQSDQPLKSFLNDLPMYFDLVKSVTVTAAPRDPVLRLAKMTDGQRRLGAVSETDTDVALDAETVDRLTAIFASERMVVIDLSEVPLAGYRFVHGAWYARPWVSTDVLVTLLGGLTPAERGLESTDVNGIPIWRFPPDYVERIRELIRERGPQRL